MTTIKSHLTGRAIVISFPDDPERLLLVEVDIDCPGCGEQHLKIAGHHLRALLTLITEFMVLHPDLVGDEAGLQIIKRMAFTGIPSPTPENN